MQTGMEALRARMEYLLACPQIEGHASDAVMKQERPSVEPVPWVLEEWRRTAIPEWRSKLQQCIEEQDRQQEIEARWMLGEILKDPDYLKTDE